MISLAAVLPAFKCNLASTRRSIVLAFVVAALFCVAPQAHAGVNTCANFGSLTSNTYNSTQTTATFNLVAGDTITLSTNFNGDTEANAFVSNNGDGSLWIDIVGGVSTGFQTESYVVPASGTYSLSVGALDGPFVFKTTCVPPAAYTVTVSTDTTPGTASNCTAGSTTDASCSLRDALAAAAANTNVSSSNPATIQFSSTKFTAATTITEANGTFNIPSNTTIQGLTTGSGATLTNLITVSGNNAFTVFTVGSGVTFAFINNLTITNRLTAVDGGGISNAGTLTVNQSTITGAALNGGGIYNTGTLTVNNSTLTGSNAFIGGALFTDLGSATITASTIAGNTSSYDAAGIWVNSGSVTISNSTITGNSTTNVAGGLLMNQGSTVTLSNSIVAGNSAASPVGEYADFYNNNGTFNNNGNLIYTGSAFTTPSGSVPSLAPLGFYGGPTQTMPVLPNSLAFCTTNTTTAPGTTTTDQRGVTIPAHYSSFYCTDTGATNSSYSIAWTTQPASTIFANTTLNPVPAVQFEDNGYAIPATGTIQFNDASTSLLNHPVNLSLSSGAASLSGSSFTTVTTGDYLHAFYTLNIGSFTPTLSSASSSTFNVVISANHFAFTAAPPTSTTAGTSFSVTVTAYSSTDNSAVATNYTGPIKFTSTDAAAVFPTSPISLTAGVGTFSITLKTAGTQTITVADSSGSPSTTSSNITVNAAAAATITAASGSGQSAVIGAAFTNPLAVQVLDAYSNPIGGNVVTFTVPSTGASATPSATTCTTSLTNTPSGGCSVTVVANGVSNSATSYSVTAKATGITNPATFTLTNSEYATTITTTPTATSINYGQPVTLNTTFSPLSVGGNSPTGSVTYFDGVTTLTPTSTVTNAPSASYTVSVPAVAVHTYYATYGGDSNFSASTKTQATSTVTVSKAGVTLTGPTTQPVQITVNAGGSVPITVTGQYSGTGVSTPSGSIGYTIGSPCAASCTGTALITSGAATIPTPSTLVSGPYTVAVTYAGDTNYNAATGINVSIQIGQLTPTVTYPAQTAITYGTTLVNNLNATTAYNTTPLTSGGTTAYTATLQPSGTPVAVTTSTVLAAGTYTLTATWTPNSTNSTLYKSASNTSTLLVNKAPLTVTVNAVSSVYGVAFPTFTGTVTGVVTGDGITATYATTASPTSAPGGSYSITATLVDPNTKLGNYTVTNTPAALTITKAVSAVSITQVAPLPVTGGTGVGVATTFVAAVSDATASSTGTPTGTVQFYNGLTAIGSPVTLSGATASLTYTFTTVQTASITAMYSGDGNFSTNTSSAFSEAVVTPGYTVAANPTSLAVTRGTVGTATLTFTPFGNYQGTATYICTGLPAFASCVFTPATIAFTGNNAQQTSTLQIFTIAPHADPGVTGSAILWIPGMMLAMLLFVRRRKFGTATRGLLMLLVLACAAFGVSGCGSTSYVTPTGTDSVVVNVTATATAGSGFSNLNQTATISITIQ